ncbi:MAG TPA: hypothetical protein VFS62_11325 [Chloroflexota bacterium]|nr:hypothetical protein [Chloroflexota bacterium]
MEYWQEMRALVGTRPLLFVGCVALMYRGEAAVLGCVSCRG